MAVFLGFASFTEDSWCRCLSFLEGWQLAAGSCVFVLLLCTPYGGLMRASEESRPWVVTLSVDDRTVYRLGWTAAK